MQVGTRMPEAVVAKVAEAGAPKVAAQITAAPEAPKSGRSLPIHH